MTAANPAITLQVRDRDKVMEPYTVNPLPYDQLTYGPDQQQGGLVESAEPHPMLPQLRLDDLLAELQGRLQAVVNTRDRVPLEIGFGW